MNILKTIKFPKWMSSTAIISIAVFALIVLIYLVYMRYFHFPKTGIVKENNSHTWEDENGEQHTVNFIKEMGELQIMSAIGSEYNIIYNALDTSTGSTQHNARILKKNVEILKN